jgi:thioredoxin-related protein
MKYLLLTFFCLSITLSTIAQDSHITFETENWEAALQKAKAENKIIFVDAYTTWCGPCKMMAKNVFTDQAVSDYYNEHFINMKIDMEKGEGILFSRAYDIRAYPTYVFVDAHGEIAHKGLGYMEPDKFIAFGEAASDEDNRLGTLAMRYQKGDRSPELLKQYAEVLSDAYDNQAGDIAEAYLMEQQDWSTPENAKFLVTMAKPDPKSKLYQYMASNRQTLLSLVDPSQLDETLKAGAMLEIQAKNMTYDEQETHFHTLFKDKGGEYFAEYNMRKYSRFGDDEKKKEKYLEAASHYINTYHISNWRLLNAVAWNFYESTDDKSYLNHAMKWATTSVNEDSNYMNNDTAAAVAFKLGDKKTASFYAQQAIKLAKESGEDYAETSKLLEKIQAL